MRKKISTVSVVLFLLLSGHSLYAQKKLSVGIQGGLGGATAYHSYKGEDENISDLELGIPKIYPVFSHMYNLYLSYRINEDFGIAFEPGMIRKGYGYKNITEDRDVVFSRKRMDYMQLPLLAEFHVEESIVLTVGPEFGYLWNAKLSTSVNSGPNGITELPKRNRFDCGIQIGGYYTLKKYLDVGIKVGSSLTKADKFYLINDYGEVVSDVSKRYVYVNSFIRVKL